MVGGEETMVKGGKSFFATLKWSVSKQGCRHAVHLQELATIRVRRAVTGELVPNQIGATVWAKETA
eukprot:7170535-Prymnesium_polylepis.2